MRNARWTSTPWRPPGRCSRAGASGRPDGPSRTRRRGRRPASWPRGASPPRWPNGCSGPRWIRLPRTTRVRAPMNPRLCSLLLGGALLAFAAGCAGASTKPDAKNAPKTEGEAILQKGLEALKDKNYEEARTYFDLVTARYPFLDVART